MKTAQEIAMLTATKAEDWHQHSNGGGWVYKTASIKETAFIGPNAQVSGDARVYGDAQVSGNTWETSPLYIKGSRHALTNCAYGKIAIGCHVYTFAEWKRHTATIGKAESYTPEQIKEYRGHIAHIIKYGR